MSFSFLFVMKRFEPNLRRWNLSSLSVFLRFGLESIRCTMSSEPKTVMPLLIKKVSRHLGAGFRRDFPSLKHFFLRDARPTSFLEKKMETSIDQIAQRLQQVYKQCLQDRLKHPDDREFRPRRRPRIRPRRRTANPTTKTTTKTTSTESTMTPVSRSKRPTIPGAGKGLFAIRNILKGTFIAEYTGKVITLAEYEKNDTGYGVIIDGTDLVVDSSSVDDSIVRYANDCRTENIQKNHCNGSNTKLVHEEKDNRMWLKATEKHQKRRRDLLVIWSTILVSIEKTLSQELKKRKKMVFVQRDILVKIASKLNVKHPSNATSVDILRKVTDALNEPKPSTTFVPFDISSESEESISFSDGDTTESDF